jgi:protein phosphatase
LFGLPATTASCESASKSITGGRNQNQDRCYSNDRRQFYLVADGMGGYKGGALASQIAVESVPEAMQEASKAGKLSTQQHIQAFRAAVYSACFEMSKVAEEHEGYGRMGCTLAAAYVAGDTLYYGNVGDCRVYLYRKNRLIQLTVDETMVQNLIKARIITKSQARAHRLRHIVTNSVSARGVQHAPILLKTNICQDDIVLVTSDGLVNELTDADISAVLRDADSTKSCVEQLIGIAVDRGAHDNVSCIVFRPAAKQISSVAKIVARDDATYSNQF